MTTHDRTPAQLYAPLFGAVRVGGADPAGRAGREREPRNEARN
jgi:hypothetical protein